MSLASTWKMVGRPNPSLRPSSTWARPSSTWARPNSTWARMSSLGKRARGGVASVDKDRRKTVKVKTPTVGKAVGGGERRVRGLDWKG